MPMPIVRCKNKRVENAEMVECKRYFALIPQCAIDALKAFPGEEMMFRCPTCPSDAGRWAAVYAKPDGKLVFHVKHEGPRNEPDLEFDETIIAQPYG